MTTEDIPTNCPSCGGEIRMRPQIDGTALGGRNGKEWRCAKGCMSWTAK